MGIFSRPLQLGEVITFRYTKPNTRDKMPLVMVFAEVYENHLHGINLRYVNPAVTEKLYWFFRLPEEQKKLMDPFVKEEMKEANQVRLQQEMAEKYWQYKQSQLQNQTGVIVKPNVNNAFGVSTFTRTPTTVQPTRQLNLPFPPVQTPQQGPQNYQEYQQQQDLLRQRQMEVEQRARARQMMQQEAAQKDYLGNPYVFYHRYVKPMLGGSKMVSMVYRKYNPVFMNSVRIVRGLERLYSGWVKQ